MQSDYTKKVEEARKIMNQSVNKLIDKNDHVSNLAVQNATSFITEGINQGLKELEQKE